MIMPVMRVRKVLVRMRHGFMVMHVRVPFARRHRRIVLVSMVLIVFVLVLVIHGAMNVAMGVVLGEVQPYA